ncbi:MAG: chromate transporter [Treponema sp.]
MKDRLNGTKLKLLLDIFVTFFKIGIVTFGGGLAMLPILERELVVKKKWIESDELIDYFAIGQSTPGIIAVNVATFCGHKLSGVTGGITATVGIVMPSVIIISVIARLIDSINEFSMIRKALTGINAAVAANLTYACVNFVKKTIKNVLGLVLFFASFACVFFFNVPAFIVIFSSAFLGIIIFYFSKLCGTKKSGGHK